MRFACALVVGLLLHGAAGEPGGGGFVGDVSGGGSRVGMTYDQAKRAATAGETAGVNYRYVSVSFCAEDPTDWRTTYYCEAAIRECANNTPEQGLGPANRIFRQAEGSDIWEFRGVTCFPNLVDDGPELTMAMILEAFHDTAFAVPEVTTQPKGDVTLVTLPTYYQVVWPDAGYAPNEIDTTTLLGFQVDIRPRLDSITYHFGDGETEGPTRDEGGPYPTGNVIHEYTAKGSYQARADVVYGGQFRVNGGAWADIPGTASISGAETTVTVRESRARLVTGGG